ncbi:MAG: hypothetical protein JRM79_03400 [Nitrososphaerota archaeon]|nr:hypothetical protein [Nitrososphaerota archaeon]MDG6912761.1 hypothetical protein [Nitrososphaerota archaeon]MDG6941282.1 hypothetical protein [Nitrososphaerota archaeon]MDG6958680.1 hypothetical protein [Nitrososphaerota archaeon]MDG6971257.1 hypothetical protein [Nitrososphaerota archaeon]
MSGEEKQRRRLAAVMFTDIVGYTKLTQLSEQRTLEALGEHNTIVRDAIAKHGGREVKTIGDSFLAEFDSALEALRCAVDIQQSMRSHWPLAVDGQKMTIRIGIHLGDVVEEGGDLFGDAVNIASRVESCASPGGVCVSQQVYDQIHNKVEYAMERLEGASLKNVSFPTPVYSVIIPWRASLAGAEGGKFNRKRVAVLPFVSMSPDPNDEYFADGMTEELISALSKIEGLSVISRTSVSQYKQKKASTPAIAAELRAGTILEGSVRKSGSRVRVAVQLIDANEDEHLWAESYDREVDDVFAIQSDIAVNVARETMSKLIGSRAEEIGRGPTNSSEAHAAYMLAKYSMNMGTREGLVKAIANLESAVALDPGFALAYAALANCYTYMAGIYLPDKEAFEMASRYASMAVKIDSSSGEAHLSLGTIAFQHEWDWEKAGSELSEAARLNPGSAEAHMWMGGYLAILLRTDEAMKELMRAEDLDPLSPLVKLNIAYALYLARRYDESITKCEETVALSRDLAEGYLVMALSYAAKGMYEEAIRAEQRSPDVKGRPPKGSLGYIYALAGRKEEALGVLRALEQLGPSTTGIEERVLVLIGLGEYDRALDLMEEALEGRHSWLVIMAQGAVFDPMRRLPRFASFMRRIGLEASPLKGDAQQA